MAGIGDRKVEDVVVPAWGGRDIGKTFRITEMDAISAEKWAWRFFIVIKGTSGQLPANLEQLGMVAVAIAGVNALLAADVDWTLAEPRLDELIECVRIIRDPRHPDIATDLTGIGNEISEPRTVAWLRSEVIRVHTDFSPADALLSLVVAAQRASAALAA